MKTSVFSLIFCFLLLSCSSSENDVESVLLVGAAQEVINPDDSNFIAGDRKNRHFAGINDSLYVKSVVLTSNNQTLTIITFDCIGLLYPTLQEIRNAVAEHLSDSTFNPESIVMSSTHTHSGPDVVGIWGADELTSGVNPEYMKNLVSAAVSAIMKAWQAREPASGYYADTTHGEDWVYNISKPEELDRSLSILQFKGRNGNSIATLTNFACHPTILDAVNDKVSSDYVGGFYSEMDDRFGGTNLFLQGAIGGWVQPEYEEKTIPNAMARGRKLAEVVTGTLEESKPLVSPIITFKSRVFHLPVSNQGFSQLAALGVIDREITDSVKTEIAWFSIGNAMFVTHPGETSPAYSIASKKLMDTNGPKFVLGLGMDALGYIVTPDFFNPSQNIPHAGYLTGMSVDSLAGTQIMKVVEKLAME